MQLSLRSMANLHGWKTTRAIVKVIFIFAQSILQPILINQHNNGWQLLQRPAILNDPFFNCRIRIEYIEFKKIQQFVPSWVVSHNDTTAVRFCGIVSNYFPFRFECIRSHSHVTNHLKRLANGLAQLEADRISEMSIY